MREKDLVSFIPLHHNWFHILLSLVGAEQHGYGIMQEVLERTNGAVRIWPATLYGSLKRLIADGLIEESDERPVAELDDARRRYYKLTRLGKKVLELECERLQDMLRMAQTQPSIDRPGSRWIFGGASCIAGYRFARRIVPGQRSSLGGISG